MRRPFWTILTLLALWLVACQGTQGELNPLNPTATSGGDFSGQPILVTFSELQADPLAYRDVLIRVTGSLAQGAVPDCVPHSGPVVDWSLIAEGLRLDVSGLPSVQRVAEGTDITLDGVFRLYEGPLGCGKRPPPDTAWYLEALQIIQPNPIVLASGGSGVGGPAILPPSLTTPLSITPAAGQLTPTPESSPGTEVATLPPTPTLTPTDLATVTETVTPEQTLTAIATLSLTPATTLSPAATSGPGTPTVTPTASGTPDLASTATPLVTSTPEEYPAPPTSESTVPPGYP